MINKQINIVWCDDKIDILDNEDNRMLFERHNCKLYKKARTSEELSTILKNSTNFVDAVIVDFNMSDKELVPEESTARGFRWIHEHVLDYAPLPFYLYSARDENFIDETYKAMQFNKQDDYFFNKNTNVKSKRNRYFHTGELEDLLGMIEEEVECIATPSFKIRKEFSKAISALEKQQLDSKVFIDILLLDESVDRMDLCDFANPLRKVIEDMTAKLQNAGIIPINCDLNSIPKLLHGDDRKNGIKYATDDLIPNVLFESFNFFLEFTQDGSHNKNYLSLDFHKYLQSSGDTYIVKALAIIGLDIIVWMDEFYDKYEKLKLFELKGKKVIIKGLTTVDGQSGAIAEYDGLRLFFPQHPKYKHTVGSNVEIISCRPTQKIFGDVYCFGKNLDVSGS